ncbi:unnamed protein product [Phytomonas sp. EM1]|nr:unnamed protein product [Phytomonas sp. EM1]|eukprot:CCW59958.1 unnamed protein product [Phytomonas sp. isolate EM1]
MLTEEMILDKTNVHRLEEVRRLNLWGKGLTDVSIVSKLKNVEVLALAANQISSLQPFASCTTLQELYLRKNAVEDLREIPFLRNLAKLHTLWLMDNPCARHPRYREFVLHCCSALKKLDSLEVSPDERAAAEKSMSPKVVGDIMGYDIGLSAMVLPPERLAASAAGPKSPHSSTFQGESKKLSVTREHRANGDMMNHTSQGAQHAMLTAIVALLPELTLNSLEMLEQEVHDHIEMHKARLKELPSNSH